MPEELFPYQVLGAEFAARRERSGILDEPGAGKTCQAIRALDLRRLKRGIIICPAHLRENWRAEIRKFSHFERTTVKGRTPHDFVAWAKGVFDIMVISFEKATRWKQVIDENAELLDFCIIDEAQGVNNLETARAQAILGPEGTGHGGIVQWAAQAMWLTGTPMPNDPAQCYAFLRFVGATDMTFGRFQRLFFFTRNSTYGQRNSPRPENVATLQTLIGNNAMWRTLEQVGHELPPIHMTTMMVDGNTEDVRKMLAEAPGLDKSILKALESGGLSFLDSQHVATLRRLIAEAKAVPYAHMLIDDIKQTPGRKYVVFGTSREALQSIRDTLVKAGVWTLLIQGGVSDAARNQAVKDFQTNPACRVWIGNMIASGTGYTLTAAHHVDIFESSWNPSLNDQAIKRVRRISQKLPQHARFIMLADSFDTTVTRIVVDKTKNISMVEGNRMLAMPSV